MNSANNMIIKEGKAKCILEPMEKMGLERYVFGNTYHFQEMRDSKGQYFRVYPYIELSYHYETCGPNIFAKFFKEV